MSELQSPSIPWQGVRRVLADWSGPGDLIAFLANDDEGSRTWSESDLELRAHWLNWLRSRDRVELLPATNRQWLQATPARTERLRETSPAPGAHTDWVGTRIAHGWPPREFETTRRVKTRADELLQLGRWASAALSTARTAALRIGEVPGETASRRVDVMQSYFSSPGSPPISADIVRAGRAAGYPWNVLAAIAETLRPDLETLARGLVEPDEKLQAKLFQLGTLGIVLNGMSAEGEQIESIRPLAKASSPGPAYESTGYRVWFEAGAVWSDTGTSSSYDELRKQLGLQSGPLAPDLLVENGRSAVVIECKYSLREEYAIRGGYYQAFTYGTELNRIFDRVDTVIAVPDDILGGTSASVELTKDLVLHATGPATLWRTVQDALTPGLPAS